MTDKIPPQMQPDLPKGQAGNESDKYNTYIDAINARKSAFI